MHTTNLRRVGGSVMLAVPPALLDVLNLSAGTTVGVSVEDGRLVIIAVQGGVAATFDAGLVLRRRLVITGSTLRPRSNADKAAMGALAGLPNRPSCRTRCPIARPILST